MSSHIDNDLIQEDSEQGVTMVEYALLCALIAIIAIAAIQFLGQRISGQFSNIGDQIN